MLRILTLLVFSALLVAGCSTREPLQSRSATNTASVDLSGDWILRGAENPPRRDLVDGEQPFRIPKRNSQGRPWWGWFAQVTHVQTRYVVPTIFDGR